MTTPTPPINSGLRDNHTRGTVADFLKGKIQDASRLSVVSAYFTIYAYDALKDSLDRIEHLDFLFGEPSFVNRLDPSKTVKKAFIIDADGLELANKLQQKRIAKECAVWIERKVDIKTIKQSNLLHGKMYHVDHNGVEEAIKERKGIPPKEQLMDRMDTTELAANQFRMTQTRDKLAHERVNNQQQAIRTHEQVGKEVREAIKRIWRDPT